MFDSATFQNRHTVTGEERLWRAVIAKTLEEWVRGPLRYSRMAEEFLFINDKDFFAVCSSAGMDPRNLRERLQTIRKRLIQERAGRPHPGRSEISHLGLPKSLTECVS
jgi:hypothetical protein